MENKENKKPNIKILVACHKPDLNIRQDDIYMPIHVGKALNPDLDLGFIGDNTGDNISNKNPYYCELTALYWAWKNLKDVDYIGLSHYRRYFSKNIKFTGILKLDSIDSQNLIDIKSILSLKDNEVILPKFMRMSNSVQEVFNNRVMEQDIYILYKIIKEKYPNYLDTFTKYLLGNNKTGFNMFIMNKTNFDKYCQWIFEILELSQHFIKPTQYSSYNRIYGYFGEILTAVYCIQNFKIKENTVLLIDKKESNNIFKNLIVKTLNSISYFTGLKWRKKNLDNPYWDTYLKKDGIEI